MEFGLNRKAQGALQVVAHVTRNYGHHLHEGWRNVRSRSQLLAIRGFGLVPPICQANGLGSWRIC